MFYIEPSKVLSSPLFMELVQGSIEIMKGFDQVLYRTLFKFKNTTGFFVACDKVL